MAGVAVKVTEVPVQIVVDEAEIDTEGVNGLFTVIVMILLVTGGFVPQAVGAVVSITFT